MSGNVKRPGGTGLGLFVIKGIMQHHKGEMLIESDGIGKGSTFTLVLPLKKAS
jgi:signal transduction histidine kinase